MAFLAEVFADCTPVRLKVHQCLKYPWAITLLGLAGVENREGRAGKTVSAREASHLPLDGG